MEFEARSSVLECMPCNMQQGKQNRRQQEQCWMEPSGKHLPCKEPEGLLDVEKQTELPPPSYYPLPRLQAVTGRVQVYTIQGTQVT